MRTKCEQQKCGQLLVIGCGNELRSDDGAGPRIAEMVSNLKLSGVRAVARSQLAPDLVREIAIADRVVFVDAARDSFSLRVREIRLPNSGGAVMHGDPPSLLRLASLLYDHRPPALWVTIPAKCFGFGYQLSRSCRKAMHAALDLIESLSSRHTFPRRRALGQSRSCRRWRRWTAASSRWRGTIRLRVPKMRVV